MSPQAGFRLGRWMAFIDPVANEDEEGAAMDLWARGLEPGDGSAVSLLDAVITEQACDERGHRILSIGGECSCGLVSYDLG